ncbi:MAG: lmo0937 family membrane protein [Pricia sp.]|nr:lmo0937 family membrane protein [Pricia sp.]
MRDIVWIIVVILVIGWLIGFVAFPDVGGILHALLVIAAILIIYKLVTGKKV